ncbi:MAG: IS200/IS605 family accessory protein TnpB-related protein [Nitrososphaera sp.]
MPAAVRSITQPCSLPDDILEILENFRRMVNDCIRIGLQNNASTLKRLAMLSYHQLSKYRIVSHYKKSAISCAAFILSNRKKSLMRGCFTKDPYMKKPLLVSYRGFKMYGKLFSIPVGGNSYFHIVLNDYARSVLSSDPSISIRTFALTPVCLSIRFTKEVQEIECSGVIGADLNLENVTIGNRETLIRYDLSKATDIAENTRSIMRSFKRSDARIRRKIASKYGKRRQHRVSQLLHKVSKAIVQQAKKQKMAIAVEDIRYIRGMYRRGNYQNKTFRAKMNSWPFHEIKRQITYKALSEGVPVLQLSFGETKGTSSLCPQCGKRTQVAARNHLQRKRQVWCVECERWYDRDSLAAINISSRGLLKFGSPKGAANEAMLQDIEPDGPAILRVDAAKLNPRMFLEALQIRQNYHSLAFGHIMK